MVSTVYNQMHLQMEIYSYVSKWDGQQLISKTGCEYRGTEIAKNTVGMTFSWIRGTYTPVKFPLQRAARQN